MSKKTVSKKKDVNKEDIKKLRAINYGYSISCVAVISLLLLDFIINKDLFVTPMIVPLIIIESSAALYNYKIDRDKKINLFLGLFGLLLAALYLLIGLYL